MAIVFLVGAYLILGTSILFVILGFWRFLTQKNQGTCAQCATNQSCHLIEKPKSNKVA